MTMNEQRNKKMNILVKHFIKLKTYLNEYYFKIRIDKQFQGGDTLQTGQSTKRHTVYFKIDK